MGKDRSRIEESWGFYVGLDSGHWQGEYPEFSDEQVERAMAEMDEGYLAQDYYRHKALIHLEGDREETFHLRHLQLDADFRKLSVFLWFNCPCQHL